MLLSRVRGPVSFKALRTINGIEFKSFQEACNEYGFLNNDCEWQEVLAECGKCGFAPQIRQLFVHIIVNCQVTNINNLWNSGINLMTEDVLFNQRLLCKKPDLTLSDEDIIWHAISGEYYLLKLFRLLFSV